MKNKYFKFLVKILPFILLFLVSMIPVYFTRGKLAIGGDTILPFGPEGVQKFLWQWYGSENGQYFAQNLAPLFLIYKLSGYLGLSLTAISSVIFFFLSFISGLAIYKLCDLVYKPANKIYLSFPVIFYVLSPAVLNGWHYNFIYAFAPWFVYFVTKILITRKITISDIVFSNVILFFASVDLPNPKYLFFLFLFAFAMIVMALLLKIINFGSIARNWWKLILFSLCSLYLFLPLVFFAFNYSPENYGVHTRQNYSDSGLFMDQGSSTIDKMVQLHHSGININAGERASYNSSMVVVFAGSIFFICILINLFFKKKDGNYKIELTFLTTVCLFLFFAVGPNPPLGFLYMALVSNVGLLAFLRTTAGAVFFLSILYSVLLFGFIENFKGKNKIIITILLFVTLFVTSYPLIDGKFYKNLDVVGNNTVDVKSYGVNLPDEYFEIKKIVDIQKVDGKLLQLKNNLAYINTTWGYFGPSVYNYLFNYYNIGFNNIFSIPANHSVAYTLDDKSLIIDKNKVLPDVGKATTIADNDMLQLETVSPDNYIPHFWVPTKSYKVDGFVGDLPEDVANKNIGEAIYLTGQNKQNKQSLSLLPDKTSDKPVIEYKKINPTKYRIVVHQARTAFPFIFNEAFNTNWKIYQEDYKPEDSESLIKSLSSYIKYDSNENFQASKEEVSSDIDTGLISRLTPKESSNTQNEASKLDFVSKNMLGTIQNDNLSDGSVFETLFQKPVFADSRLVANGYANSWMIDPRIACEQSSLCHKNTDGSYDFEIVAEFLPQRIFWFGLIISLATIIICLSVLIIQFIQSPRRHRKNI